MTAGRAYARPAKPEGFLLCRWVPANGRNLPRPQALGLRNGSRRAQRLAMRPRRAGGNRPHRILLWWLYRNRELPNREMAGLPGPITYRQSCLHRRDFPPLQG